MKHDPLRAGSKEAGLTLIEVLISLALGLLLIAGVIQIFIGTKTTNNLQEGLSRVQENGRFALESLKPDLRMAGLSDMCATSVPTPVSHLDTGHADYDEELYGLAPALHGWEFSGTGQGGTYLLSGQAPAALGQWDGGLTALLDNKAIAGSDVLLVRRVEPIPGVTADPTAPNGPAANVIALNTVSGLDKGAVLLVSNCMSADLFQNASDGSAASLSKAANTGKSPGNVSGSIWSASYGSSMQVYKLSNALYYVGISEFNAAPALFRMIFDPSVTGGHVLVNEEIISGVESLQALYGEMDAGNLVYRSADQVVDWQNVVSVQLALLMRSPNTVGPEGGNADYDMVGTTIQVTADRLYRQVFESTIAVRNPSRS